jgi:hypothetical protein
MARCYYCGNDYDFENCDEGIIFTLREVAFFPLSNTNILSTYINLKHISCSNDSLDQRALFSKIQRLDCDLSLLREDESSINEDEFWLWLLFIGLFAIMFGIMRIPFSDSMGISLLIWLISGVLILSSILSRKENTKKLDSIRIEIKEKEYVLDQTIKDLKEKVKSSNTTKNKSRRRYRINNQTVSRLWSIR